MTVYGWEYILLDSVGLYLFHGKLYCVLHPSLFNLKRPEDSLFFGSLFNLHYHSCYIIISKPTFLIILMATFTEIGKL